MIFCATTSATIQCFVSICFTLTDFHPSHLQPTVPSFQGKIIKMSNRSSQAIIEMAKSRYCQKGSKKAEFSQVFRLPGFCRDPTNTFAKLPINSGHLFMRPSPQIQMLDLAGFVIFPCLWNICILWNVECIMNWTVAHVYNSFKASLKCTQSM